MKKYAKIVNEETKAVSVGTGTNTAFYKSIGMSELDVEQAYNGGWYLSGFAPVEPEKTVEEQNEEIRAKREAAYIQTSDKLKADYDEAVARGSDNAEELKQAWLESKDKIRTENPYVTETEEETVEKPEIEIAVEEPVLISKDGDFLDEEEEK